MMQTKAAAAPSLDSAGRRCRLSFVALLLACGCTGHGSEQHRADLSKLVGISEAELERRLGQPDSSSGDVSQKFLVYDHIHARYVNPAVGYRYDHDYPTALGRAPAIAEQVGTPPPSCAFRTTSACFRCLAILRKLNPIENVWEFLRANFLSHRIWESYDAIVDACCDAWNALMRMPEQIASITTRSWARVKV
jgi:hypothetical protein